MIGIKQVALALATLGLLSSSMAQAALGTSAQEAAYSAKQIKLNNPLASSGIYWFDADGAGALSPFLSYADMATLGGGWTLVHDQLGLPDMDGFASSVLAIYGPSSFRILGNGFDATFDSSNINSLLNPNAWTYSLGSFGYFQAATGITPNTVNLLSLIATRPNIVTVYVRENVTPAVPTVPEPETYAMLLAGLGLLAGVARHQQE
jgi:hypothetical protein